ncbi:hypothetical protein [Streptomyces sp. NPDC000410]|uniref:hypothetical protein n=1 Tax=Streptomyces sp. NPDC000410 TaxID=3154254 RepID=UPI003325AAFE
MALLLAADGYRWWAADVVRDRLLHMLGRMDEGRYWFYQAALCALDGDPSDANALYDRAARESEAAAWGALVARLTEGTDGGPTSPPGSS